jgi:DNA excision repair protein ERCC-3
VTEPPLIVQTDRTVLLETQHPDYEAARDRLARFAELEKSPEYVHFYKITPVSIWNAAALGERAEDVVDWLVRAARFPIVPTVLAQIREWFRRYSLLRLTALPDGRLRLHCDDADALAAIGKSSGLADMLAFADDGTITLEAHHRGEVKQALVKLGYPVDDRAGYRTGATLSFALREAAADAAPRGFRLRDYQSAAAAAFHAGGSGAARSSRRPR